MLLNGFGSVRSSQDVMTSGHPRRRTGMSDENEFNGIWNMPDIIWCILLTPSFDISNFGNYSIAQLIYQ